ncbi:hypothetical protein L1987_85147 [Smallanthus sonchifolius]|uniref:Uncharacterized protein n=1 Tax=Smallanthus sonchifolius TaxID=185202 RepID=A0ACB8XV68_9ASTR|nr:hypothetical protein L1987_85147 [Smallanthus sonchifolius]
MICTLLIYLKSFASVHKLRFEITQGRIPFSDKLRFDRSFRVSSRALFVRNPNLRSGALSEQHIFQGKALVTISHYQLIYMSELDLQIPSAFDPFAESNVEDSGAGSKDYVHIRIHQRNDRKSLTTVQGLKKEFSYNKILKDFKKEFCCNGTVVQDTELGQVFILKLI